MMVMLLMDDGNVTDGWW